MQLPLIRLCKDMSCTRNAVSFGMCDKHYRQWRKTQDPSLVQKERDRSKRRWQEDPRYRDRIKKARDEFYATDYGKATLKAYNDRNRERINARSIEYNRNHPEERLEWSRKRRVLLSSAAADFTKEDWNEMLMWFSHCAYCLRSDVALTIDHMTPISRGGDHVTANIVPSCQSCNSQKNAKTLLEYIEWRTKVGV